MAVREHRARRGGRPRAGSTAAPRTSLQRAPARRDRRHRPRGPRPDRRRGPGRGRRRRPWSTPARRSAAATRTSGPLAGRRRRHPAGRRASGPSVLDRLAEGEVVAIDGRRGAPRRRGRGHRAAASRWPSSRRDRGGPALARRRARALRHQHPRVPEARAAPGHRRARRARRRRRPRGPPGAGGRAGAGLPRDLARPEALGLPARGASRC